MSHNPLTRTVERKLCSLQRLTELVEETLVSQAAELDARLTAEAERFAEEERQEFFEHHAEDYFELADEFPTLLRYSVLTGADTGLEVYLNDTCATYAEVNAAPVSLGDFRGTGIERAREYLKKVARVQFPDFLSEWTTVRRLHDLRNAIVHADGYVPPDRTALRQWSRTVRGLEITPLGVISLKREFTGAAIDAYAAFVKVFDESCETLGLWRSVFPAEDA